MGRTIGQINTIKWLDNFRNIAGTMKSTPLFLEPFKKLTTKLLEPFTANFGEFVQISVRKFLVKIFNAKSFVKTPEIL